MQNEGKEKTSVISRVSFIAVRFIFCQLMWGGGWSCHISVLSLEILFEFRFLCHSLSLLSYYYFNDFSILFLLLFGASCVACGILVP